MGRWRRWAVYLGATVGQGLGKIPLVGRWLRRNVQFIGASYCSEHAVTSMRAGDPRFQASVSPQDTPGEIDEALAAPDSGYELWQFEVPGEVE